MEDCCFCKLPVLGIAGQDDILDSYNFRTSEEDDLAISEGVYGHCHLKCLLKSSWKEFWKTRRVKNYVEIRQFKLIYDDSHSQVFRYERTGDFLIFPEPYIMLPIMHSTLRKGLNIDNSCIRMEKERLHWELPTSITNLSVDNFFDHDGCMSLLKLAEIFGVQDYFYDEQRALEGKILLVSKKTSERLGKRILVGDVLCSVSIPDDLGQFLVKYQRG